MKANIENSLTPALTPALSPRRGSGIRASNVWRERVGLALTPDLQAGGERFSLSPGDRAGVRASVPPYSSGIFFPRRVTHRKQQYTKKERLLLNVERRSDFSQLKSLLRSSLCALCVLLWQSALAGVHYVDVNSTNATPPYTNWATAATNIQDAVDAAVAGEEILVTNGVYRTGSRAAPAMVPGTNRLAVTKALAIRSVNGPAVTVIQG